MIFCGNLTLRDIVKVYLMTLLIGCLFSGAQAVIDLFIQALFNHYFNRYAVRFIDPIASFLLGGPTFNAIRAIYRVTPILNPSILGQRLDTQLTILTGSTIQALTVVVTTFIEFMFRTCIDITIAIGVGVANAASSIAGGVLGRSLKIGYGQTGIRNQNGGKRNFGNQNSEGKVTAPLKTKSRIAEQEAPVTTKSRIAEQEAPATTKSRFAEQEAPATTKSRFAMQESFHSRDQQRKESKYLQITEANFLSERTTGRFYPGREKALSGQYDVTSELLERNPLLERFLTAVDLDREDDCLKEILCSIHAYTEENLTKEEKNFKLDFRGMVERYQVSFPSLKSFVTASNTGQEEKTQKVCEDAYPKCTHPLIARAFLIYLARVTAHEQ